MSGIFRCFNSRPDLSRVIIGLQNTDRDMRKAIELAKEFKCEHFEGNMDLVQIQLENTRRKQMNGTRKDFL